MCTHTQREGERLLQLPFAGKEICLKVCNTNVAWAIIIAFTRKHTHTHRHNKHTHTLGNHTQMDVIANAFDILLYYN